MSRPPAPSKQTLRDVSTALAAEEAALRKVSKAAVERAHKLNRLTARERIALLLEGHRGLFELGLWAGHEMYPEWGEAPGGGRHRRHRPGRRPPLHDRRQRRHGEGRRLLPDDDQEGPPRPAIAAREPPAPGLPRRLRRASSCRCRTRSSPTRTTSAGSSATTPSSRRAGMPQIRRDHGQLRGRRGLPAGALRHGADDRGHRPVPRRPRAGEGGDRPGDRRRGARRRADARRDQRHGRLPASRTTTPASTRLRSLVATCCRPSPPARRPHRRRDAELRRRRVCLRHRQHRRLGAVRRARPARAASSMRDSFDEYRAEYGQTLVCGFARARRACRSASSPTSGCGSAPKEDGIQFGGVIYADSADKARAVRHGLQPDRPAAPLPPGRQRLQGRAATPSRPASSAAAPSW